MLNSGYMIVAILLAGLVGFAAHRANICSVRAVEEVLTTRRAFMLLSFVKASVWVIGITLVTVWILPFGKTVGEAWQLGAATIVGGVLFGVGAVINSGCAFSTLTRLGSGDLGMFVSLIGFLLGAGSFAYLSTFGTLPDAMASTPYLSTEGEWRLPVTLVFLLWMVWECWRLARISVTSSWRQRILAPTYRLSTAAMLMGISNALLYAMVGVWPYTRLFGRIADSTVTDAQMPQAILWLLFAGFLAGIALSARQAGRFVWRFRPGRNWYSYGFGGVLMGFGAAMIPGGNDVLILHAIPSLSVHAVPAFTAMIIGIAATLFVMRLLGQNIATINCSGDICSVGEDLEDK